MDDLTGHVQDIIRVLKYQYNLTDLSYKLHPNPIIKFGKCEKDINLVVFDDINVSNCRLKNDTLMLCVNPLKIKSKMPVFEIINSFINSLFDKNFLEFCNGLDVLNYYVQNRRVCNRFIKEVLVPKTDRIYHFDVELNIDISDRKM